MNYSPDAVCFLLINISIALIIAGYCIEAIQSHRA